MGDFWGDDKEYKRAATGVTQAVCCDVELQRNVEKEWQGKMGRTARWTRDDQMLQVSVEDYLIDPRDARVTKKTVVMVSSFVP